MVRARNYGRMGNVLFQVACAISYAIKNGIEFSVQTTTDNPFWNPIYLQHLVNPNWVEGAQNILIHETKEFVFNEIEFREEWREQQIVLDGYWQNEKYFKDYKGEILYLFDLPYEKKEGIVSVHVRRGDYLVLAEKHPPVLKEWYTKAMQQFSGMKFKFFSDDIAWCKKEFDIRSDCSFSTQTSEVDDLIEMSCCEHNINSSSTFSWWAAWLNRNPDKKIITPQKWFQDGWANSDTSDIIPEGWIKL